MSTIRDVEREVLSTKLSIGRILEDIRLLRERIDHTSGISTGSPARQQAPSLHGSLGGLLVDDHPQYAGIAQTEVITGSWTFPGITVNGNITITGTVDGVDISAHAGDTSIHVDHSTVVLTAGDGLDGGGDISANRSFAVDVTDFIDTNYGLTENSNDIRVNAGFGLTFDTGALVVDQAMAPTWTGIHRYSTAGQPTNDIGTDWGYYNHKWKTIHAAELRVETLVAQDVMATIGGQIVVSPTTKLIANCSNDATTIDVEHNSLANDDYVILKSAPAGVAQFEVMRIASSATQITGGYRYTVTRDGVQAIGFYGILEASAVWIGADRSVGGSHQWYAGDAVMELGAGYIDLTATSTILSDYGPTIAIYDRTGTTNWNDLAPVAAMGNLQSFLDYSAETYGFAAGNDLDLTPSTGFKGMTVDAVNGARLFNTDIALYNGTTQTVAMGNAGILKLGTNIANSATTQFDFDPLTGNLSLTGDIIATGGQFSGVVNIGTSGGIWQGSAGTFASPTTGLKIYNSGGVGLWESWYGGVKQVYLDTTMALKAGAGAISLDATRGLEVLAPVGSSVPARSPYGVSWVSVAGNELLQMYAYTNTGNSVAYSQIEAVAPVTNAFSSIVIASGNVYRGGGYRTGAYGSTILRATAIAGKNFDVNVNALNSGVHTVKCTYDSTEYIFTAYRSATENYFDIANQIRRGGVVGGIYVPLSGYGSHTSYDGDAISTGDYTIDTSAFTFSGSDAPLDFTKVKAWHIRTTSAWSTVSGGYYAAVSHSNAYSKLSVVTRALVADMFSDAEGIVGANSNGDFYLRVGGANTTFMEIRLLGYFV